MRKLLIVDDDLSLLQLLNDYLTQVGYKVAIAPNATQALLMLKEFLPNVIVLDVNMPDINGWQTLERIRQMTRIPVIMLTALSDEPHVLKGFALGADDYVAKPFSFAQLAARIKAILERAKRGEKSRILQVDDLVVDIETHRVQRGNQLIRLTPTEFKLLVALMEQPGQILSPRELVVRVWGTEYADDTDYIRRYIWHLRQKIQPDQGQPEYIHNERGFGYYLSSEQ